jgi:hypothetical protein
LAAALAALQLDTHAATGALAGDASALERLQPALLTTEFGRLARERKGVTNIYAIGLAGWSPQDVFLKEVGGALGAFAKALPIKNRIARLINNAMPRPEQ